MLNKNQSVSFTAIINKLIYQNKEQELIIISCKNNENSEIKIIIYNCYENYNEEQEIIVYGKTANSEKYGNYIKADLIIPTISNNLNGFKAFLLAGNIKGIGKKYSDILFEKYNNEVKNIFESESWELIKNILPISEKQLNEIIQSWNKCKQYSSLHTFLYSSGMSPFSVKKIYKIYGEKSLEIIKKNPYLLMENIGIGFKIADRIAIESGISLIDPKRVYAAILFLIEESKENGNTKILYDDLINLTESICNIEKDIIKHYLQNLIDNKKLILFKLEDKIFISDYNIFSYEKDIYNFIKKRLNIKYKYINNDNIEKNNFELSEEQINAVLGALSNSFSIIIGGAGTGKTTVIKTIYNFANKHNKSCILLAPTGRAARRIYESSNFNANTIHKALGFKRINDIKNGKKAENYILKSDIVIIDEASMIDIYLMKTIIESINIATQIIFVGDQNQLPSISCGNILYDIVSTNIETCFHLKKIFRQKNTSQIILISEKISNGIIPKINSKNADLIMTIEQDKLNGLEIIKEIFKNNFDFEKQESNIQIITPMNKGITGTNNLNITIQKICQDIIKNKNIFKKIFGRFYINDKVIQIKNDYNLGVFNGEIGKIIDFEDEKIKVDFKDKIIYYDFNASSNISLAYAITIYKAQGSEFKNIIIPLYMEHFIMWNKKSLYTAITRASENCTIIGEKKALICAVKKKENNQRETILKYFLLEKIF
jgi:exodeoxyribonuclease V alpha subunit